MGPSVGSRVLGKGRLWEERQEPGGRGEEGRGRPQVSLCPAQGGLGLSLGKAKTVPLLTPPLSSLHVPPPLSAPIRLNRCSSADRPRVLLCLGPCTCCSLCLKHSSTPFIWITLSGPSCLSFCWEASPAVKWTPLDTLCLPVLSPFSHSSLLSTHLSVCPLHQEPPESWAQCPV